MQFDATFWVAISFIIFFGALIYFKIPQSVNNLLGKLIIDIKNEIDESEKLRGESKKLLDEAQGKLNTAKKESNKILTQVKDDADRLIIEMNEKFHKSAEIKKSLAKTKISQMKELALKEIKDTSINIAMESVKKIITTTVDKSKLDNLFAKKVGNQAAKLLLEKKKSILVGLSEKKTITSISFKDCKKYSRKMPNRFIKKGEFDVSDNYIKYLSKAMN